MLCLMHAHRCAVWTTVIMYRCLYCIFMQPSSLYRQFILISFFQPSNITNGQYNILYQYGICLDICFEVSLFH